LYRSPEELAGFEGGKGMGTGDEGNGQRGENGKGCEREE